MKDGMGNLMKRAQQMQANMEKAQQELANLIVTGQAGGDMIKIVMTGDHNIQHITIEDGLLQGDKEMLEDLLTLAINDAVQQIKVTSQDSMASMLPAGIKLPF